MSNVPAKQQKPQSIRGLINTDAVREQIARALPNHLTPDRFLRVATTAILKTPKLAECSQESFMKAMLDCSSLGLEPDGRRAHLIPYGKDCQLVIDYKGLIELAKRSGEVAKWQAMDVCENDVFQWKDGAVRHEIDWRNDRGKPQCYYSHVVTKDGEHDFEVMTIAEINAIRERSKAKNSGPWVTDPGEMSKKTVIRRHAKRMTLSPEFREAYEKDFDRFEEIRQVRGREIDPEQNPFRLSDSPPNGAQGDPATEANVEGVSHETKAGESDREGGEA